MQLWYPDTCACVIEQSVVGSVINMTQFKAKCVFHVALTDKQAYDAIYDSPAGENKRKNLVNKELLENSLFALSSFNAATGLFTFKTDMGFTWTWTGTGETRVLNISVFGKTLTTAQKNTAQTWSNTLFGVGKVVIV